MNENKTFCEKCRDYVPYTTATVQMTGKIKEKEYQYTGIEARCASCGAYVYVAEIIDANLQSLYDVYRAENNIISLAMIREIPEKYHIGKRPLSILLGWGEQTFSRYYDGDIPTRQYSDMLTRIHDDPLFFSTLLETNKEKLKSNRSYARSRHAVDALLSANHAEDSKINLVIQYLSNQCEDITPLALQKALYYIQGFYYAFYRTYLFQEDCQAWVHGPVYREIYLRYRNYRFDPIHKVEHFDSGCFSAGEKAIYDSVIHNICCYSGKVLEQFTHNETPWRITRGELSAYESSNRVIEKSVIGEYFETIKSKYHMVNPCDIKAYTQDMFNAYLAL